jgi:hypothetical protein
MARPRNPYLKRWMVDCVICFVSFGVALTYFNFKDGHFYHGQSKDLFVALLSASVFVGAVVDLLWTFRRATQWRKNQI